MPKKKAQKEYGKATLAGVQKEMAQPRVTKSAKKRYANFASSVELTEARKPLAREAAESHLAGKLLKQ